MNTGEKYATRTDYYFALLSGIWSEGVYSQLDVQFICWNNWMLHNSGEVPLGN